MSPKAVMAVEKDEKSTPNKNQAMTGNRYESEPRESADEGREAVLNE